MSSSHPSDLEIPITEQEVIQKYKGLKAECRQIAEKIAELEMDANEHQLVIDTLTPLAPDRKAYRMVGGVLVQRTVKEVIPAVNSNKEGIDQLLSALSFRLKETEKQAADWQKKYNIRAHQ